MAEIINYKRQDFIGYELSVLDNDNLLFYSLVDGNVEWKEHYDHTCIIVENSQGMIELKHLKANTNYFLRPKLSIDDTEIDDYWVINVDESNHVNASYNDTNPLTNNPEFASMSDKIHATVKEKHKQPRVNKVEENTAVIACESCGSSDISLNIQSQELECNFCRHTVENEPYEKTVVNIEHLHGHVVGSGAGDIIASDDDVITYKCPNCGAEVVLDTNKETLARCHWCRTNFGVQDVIPNGAVPDMVLPFKVDKDNAFNLIQKFVMDRKFYAQKEYIEQFSAQNIIGVYLPYMVIDANYHVNYTGEAEIMTATWVETRWVGSGKDRRRVDTRYYNADRYAFNREFDVIASDLTVEANSEKINQRSQDRTNNVVNAIMPFEMEKAKKWSPLYMNGFSAQKRDLNTGDLASTINSQLLDISRNATSSMIAKSNRQFDRGYRVYNEELSIKGKQWKAAYCPVWLYSYQDKEKKLHYIAVNGQTKETMGSVPINTGKVLIISTILFLVMLALTGLFVVAQVNLTFADIFNGNFAQYMYTHEEGYLAFIPFGVAIFTVICLVWYIKSRYRNKGARHFHEKETKRQVLNMDGNHRYIRSIRRTKSPTMLW